MSNQDIRRFLYEQKPVRVMEDANGEPWFAATDVCRVLELEHTGSALRVLDLDEKGVLTMHTPGGDQDLSVVSEPGLYKLLSRSRKPEAKRFDRWVRHEVLPSIRKTGGFSLAPEPDLNDPALLRHLLLGYSERLLASEARVAELAPKAGALDQIALAEGAMCLSNAAKTLNMGPRAFFEALRALNWIFRRPGGSGWVAYQDKIKAGFLAHKITTVQRADGTGKIVEQVQMTAKGLTKLAQIFGFGDDAPLLGSREAA